MKEIIKNAKNGEAKKNLEKYDLIFVDYDVYSKFIKFSAKNHLKK